MRQKEKILNYLDEFVKNIEYKDSLKIIPFLIASIIAALTALIYSEIFFVAQQTKKPYILFKYIWLFKCVII